MAESGFTKNTKVRNFSKNRSPGDVFNGTPNKHGQDGNTKTSKDEANMLRQESPNLNRNS